MIKATQNLALVALLALLAGCTSWHNRVAHDNRYSRDLLAEITDKPLPKHKDAEIVLAESAASVSQSLQRLAEVERAVHPKAKLPTPPNASKIGLAGLASVDWNGPIEPIVKRISQASHYKLRVIGRQPAIPVVVSLNAKDKTLADLLRDIGFQAEKSVQLVVYPAHRVIELRYLAG